jgi:hypothetical protein
MKKTMLRFLALTLVVIGGFTQVQCSKGSSANVNGVYVFDTDAFKASIQKTDDPMLKSMPEDVLNQTMEGLKTFKIEVADSQATATFGTMVVKGNLSKTGDENGEVRYLMTPVDADKKNDTVNLIIKDNTLTLDPGKKETDKMYFKKTV